MSININNNTHSNRSAPLRSVKCDFQTAGFTCVDWSLVLRWWLPVGHNFIGWPVLLLILGRNFGYFMFPPCWFYIRILVLSFPYELPFILYTLTPKP